MEPIILSAKTRKEIANEYGISIKTLNRWIKKAKLDLPSGLIDPLHLKIIYKSFGFPGTLKAV